MSEQENLLWLTEQDVVRLVSLDDAVESLEAIAADAQAFNVPKALGTYEGGGALQALGSVAPGLGYGGFKTWNFTPRGGGAIFSLFSTETGALKAVIEAGALGQLRTAAMTGLGTRWLADPGADEMAIIGTGNQAIAQVAAVNIVRPLRRLRVFGPDAGRRSAFAARVREAFTFDVVEADSVAAAVQGAPLVTLVTRAREPFLASSMLARDAHLNAVGAILPTHAEFHQDVFERIGCIVVDDVPNTKQASRELIERFGGPDVSAWEGVRAIGEVIRSGERPPRRDGDISLFKSVGMGLSDLAVAKLVFERATGERLGKPIPRQSRAALRWRGQPGND
ncbi:MAG: ornithine cyclodeaminase family protein [Burkholderiaceae bacterium]